MISSCSPPQYAAPFPGVLAETDRFLILDKPAGWYTIPGRGAAGISVVSEWAQDYARSKVWVVHRLDVETSGVLLMAKTAPAHREASIWFEKHQVRKTYDFLASGQTPPPMMRLASPIAGLKSLTQVEVKRRGELAFWGRARPLSGRRHQIRIHLSEAGFPILGDSQYLGPKKMRSHGGEEIQIPRVALHASSLELPGGDSFHAPWPEDFKAWFRALIVAAPDGAPDEMPAEACEEEIKGE